ncbi:MAG: hypothetical protein M0R46_08145 [Candidatus Muirbacterium halophilum]|nr:hypothetical protein [Candidatus Muirbacterium halophilum]MCK9475873.1 hypothetical protein [Candidatus Muirbacterium halophilum]
MTKKARQYKRTTIRRLDTLSGNQCAWPGCEKKLIAEDEKSIISKICHIEAASENGPRYNPNMDDDDRRHFNNLILLCDEHHIIIDNKVNEGEYSVELLKEWKRKHENKQLQGTLQQNPTLLSLAIKAISDFDLEEVIDETVSKPFNIDEKISFNAIKRNKVLIEEYKVYYSKLNSLYTELETAGSFRKEKLLRNIKNIYLKVKGNYTKDSKEPMIVIQKNADNIIEDIENELYVMIEKESNCYQEEISFGISIIMVDAFMRCKILEKPEI